MNWRLFIMGHFRPGFIVKKKVCDLIELTGRAFAMDPPDLRHCTLDRMVEQYAGFTRTAAQSVLGQPLEQQQSVKKKLYLNAFQFGQNMRGMLHVRDMQEVMTAAALLYKLLGIEFEGDRSGEITISRCYFSSVYTAQICELISAIDAGVMAGLSNGAVMTFSQRITEGRPCCRARLFFGGTEF